VEHLQHEEGLSCQRAAEPILVAHLIIVKWKKQQGTVDDPFVALIRTSKNKKAAHAGLLGQLKAIKQPLLHHISEFHKQVIMVSTFKLVKSPQLNTTFGAKHIVVQFSAVKFFLLAHLFVYQMGTHQSQRRPDEVEAET
jgi:hypothetical protein